MSVHKRWKVFNGDDSLVFSTRNSSIIQFKTELDVFLSDNRDEDSWDFKVVGSWLNRSCVVYAKDWTPIAEVSMPFLFHNFEIDLILIPRFDNIEKNEKIK